MRPTQMRFSKAETKDLLKSWGVVSIIFAIAFAGGSFYVALFAAAITAGLGFLLHELAHKFTANYFGCSAEYRANLTMLLFSFVIVLFPGHPVFIAPGAVLVRGAQSKRENGIISAAGPATNIALALLFLAAGSLWGSTLIITLGLLINAWLALFNMIPILPFDGRKVWVWNKPTYVVMAAVSIILVGMGVFP